MTTTFEGYNSAGTTVSVSGSGVAWNPASLTAKAQLDSMQTTQYLRATNFGFGDMPNDATISGIEVQITRQDEDNTGWIVDHFVELVLNSSPIGSPDRSMETWPGTSAAIVYGDSTSNWNTSLTGADVKNATFGVQIAASAPDGAPQDIDINISKIEIRIHYLAAILEPDLTAPPCDECGECDDNCGCVSEHPIRYANGEVHLEATDLADAGFGLPWAHRRSYANRASHHGDLGHGFRWFSSSWPYLVQKTGGVILFVEDNHHAVWFDESGGSYTARHGALHTLSYNSADQEFILAKPSGDVLKFHDFSVTAAPKGIFKSATSPGGQTLSVVGYDSNDHITEVQSSYSSGGSTTIRSFKYDYLSTGDNAGRLEYVTLRRQVDGGAWANLQRLKCEYFGPGVSYGHQGDLKRVTVQQWNGSAWDDLRIAMYRYYKDGETGGSRHMLKYVVNPESYRRLAAAVADPLTATDAQVAAYADHYFEYDSTRRVTKEKVEAGTRTYTFAYTASAHPDGYDKWDTKTIETRPDSSQKVVYTNYIGQPLLTDHKQGTDTWKEAYAYDSAARRTQHATPAAVVSYDDTQANLGIALRASDGLIHVTDYYTTTGSGAAAGYVQHEKIKKAPAARRPYSKLTNMVPAAQAARRSIQFPKRPFTETTMAPAPLTPYTPIRTTQASCAS